MFVGGLILLNFRHFRADEPCCSRVVGSGGFAICELYFPREKKRTMKNFAKSVKNFLVSEDGPTAVEYAVMMALIIVVCIGTITTIGQNADTKFGKVKDALT